MIDKLYSPIIYDPISKIYYKQELNTHVGIVLNAQQQFVNKLIKQRDDYKTQRDTLIDDLSWYKAKVSRLERHNKDLRLQSDTYFEQWQQHKALNNEFSQHIGNKPSSSTYKYFRAKLDELGIKEGE